MQKQTPLLPSAHTPQQKARALAVMAEVARERLRASSLRNRFSDRGFSERTICALAEAGVDFPEMLFTKTKTQISKIPGIGPKSLAEISAYITHFMLHQK